MTTRRWSGEVEIKEPEKCDDLQWFALDQLPGTTLAYIRKALEDIAKGIRYSEAAD